MSIVFGPGSQKTRIHPFHYLICEKKGCGNNATWLAGIQTKKEFRNTLLICRVRPVCEFHRRRMQSGPIEKAGFSCAEKEVFDKIELTFLPVFPMN